MKKSVALVLSSGGSRGLAQIGVINELERMGFAITSVSGSSIGSLIGGLYAMGKLEDYAKWVATFNKMDIWELMDFTVTNHGILKGERVFDRMKTIIPDMNIEDMSIPFTAVATDIINGKEVEFRKGSFYAAVRASVAIPAVLTPVKYNNTILVDGGVLTPIPIDQVNREEGDLLVVVNLYGEKSFDSQNEKESDKKKLNGMVKSMSNLISTGDKYSLGYHSLLSRSTSIMIHKIAAMSIDKHKPDLVIDIPHNSASTFDFFKAKELIELGSVLTKEALKKSSLI